MDIKKARGLAKEKPLDTLFGAADITNQQASSAF